MTTTRTTRTTGRLLGGIAAAFLLVVGFGSLAGCVPQGSGGGTTATVYRSLVPYSGLGGTAEQIGFGGMSHAAVGSRPAGAYPVRDVTGNIVGVTSGCLSGAIGSGGTMSMCFDGPTPGADFVFGTGGTLIVTSQAGPGAPVVVDATSEPAPVPTSGLSGNLFQTYVHTSCTTNAPSFPAGACYGVSFTLQFGNPPVGL